MAIQLEPGKLKTKEEWEEWKRERAAYLKKGGGSKK
jgi:hypothetical protein